MSNEENSSGIKIDEKFFNSTTINADSADPAVGSNPFLETFEQLKSSPTNDPLMNLLNFSPDNSDNLNADNLQDIYKVLSELAEQADASSTANETEAEKTAKLMSTFTNLLGLLLKSDLLKGPLTDIKERVTEYINKNKEKLKEEELGKYKEMLENIELILEEMKKENPNKNLIMDVFYKLHEMNDIDKDLFEQITPNFKEITDLFGNNDLLKK